MQHSKVFNRQVLVRKRINKRIYGVRKLAKSTAIDTGLTTRYIYDKPTSKSFSRFLPIFFNVK